MASTPLYKKLKANGTSFYAFPGAAEDISAAYQNQNYKMYFSKYVLLNFPKQQSAGTSSLPVYWNFKDAFKKSPNATDANNYQDELVESLRNYVANFEVTMKESRLNNTEYYYDTNALSTASEKIFWRWCKKLNLVSFEPANPGDEYFNNLAEFQRNNLTDDAYFPEVLWKEREVSEFEIFNYYQSAVPGYSSNMEIEFTNVTNFRVGDKIVISGETNTNVINLGKVTKGSFTNIDVNGFYMNVVYVIPATSTTNQKVIVDVNTTQDASAAGQYTGKAKLVYHKLVQYIGEVNGINNVQEANRNYTEVYAHIPDHTGQTPDILFRTMVDVNYKPNLTFPILPSQIQPEIMGAENFTNPIVNTPQNYPGSYYGQFDTEYYTYEVASGDSLRRSGDYFGVDGDIINPITNPDTIDGLCVDFNTSHYVKMNILGRELTNFDQFNALEVNGLPPSDFEFNAILWYYTVEDNNGNIASDLYGISILDNPDNNPIESEVGLRIPTFNKMVSTDDQDGNSYAFSLNLNFNIINDNPQDTYNPEAINSLFSMNLFNQAMAQLSSTNQSFNQIVISQNELVSQISDLRGLIYTQTDLNLINKKIANLENLLKLYQTSQIINSDTISVSYNNTTNPPTIQLQNVDPTYYKIENIQTTELYSATGIIPMNISVPSNKNFLLNITNNDSTSLTLPNNDKLTIVLDRDLDYKQSFEVVVNADDNSTQNKQLEVYIKHNSGNPEQLPIETLLLPVIDLPVYYNVIQQSSNSAKRWEKFSFDLNLNNSLTLNVGSILEVPISGNSNLVQNSIKAGDTLQLKNFIVGTSSLLDFSGQYTVDFVGTTNSSIYLDVSNNEILTSYGLSSSLPLTFNSNSNYLLANNPYIDLNQGYRYKITRVLQDSEINVSGSQSTIQQMYLIQNLSN
jgi:hypothetical protein